jgi:sugar O-acyltransferase (sialic acid O-acetyltransferase NeuD family)
MEKILIVGSAGHARVVIDAVERQGSYRIVGLLDRFRELGSQTLGYQVFGGEQDLPALQRQHALHGVAIAVGDNHVRARIAEQITALCPALELVSIVHPSAQIGKAVQIGQGSVVLAGACISSGARLGSACLINTQAALDHDSVMEDFSSLGPGARTGGECRISAFSAIGLGANLVHKIHIGRHTVVGAGSLVTRNVPDHVVAYGAPAKVIRTRAEGEKYL